MGIRKYSRNIFMSSLLAHLDGVSSAVEQTLMDENDTFLNSLTTNQICFILPHDDAICENIHETKINFYCFDVRHFSGVVPLFK